MVAGIRAAYNNLKLTRDHVTEGVAKLKASVATLAQGDRSAVTCRRRAAPGHGTCCSPTAEPSRLSTSARPPIRWPWPPRSRPMSRFIWPARRLGLPSVPRPGEPLEEVPDDWAKKAPAVRAALAELINVGVKIGLEVPPHR